MTTQIYIVPLPDAQTSDPPQAGVSANVVNPGLLQQSGTATSRIAAENIDLSITGRFALGSNFSKVLRRELNSLSKASGYGAFALSDPATADLADDVGYYEVSNVDVNPAHQATGQAYQYNVALTDVGTRQDYWRSVETNVGPISTTLATGTGGLLGIPATASKVRWFDDTGRTTESVTKHSTVASEFGNVDRYDPAEPSFDDPTLLFELDYGDEGDTDVRVWDDYGRSKFFTLSNGSDVRQWAHAFHTGFEWEGNPRVDNGLIRTQFDEANGTIPTEKWNDGTSSWDAVSITYGDYELFDADVTNIGASKVDVYTEWTDTASGDIDAAVLSYQRGIADAVVRQPPNGTVPTALANALDPIASDQTTDAVPDQGTTERGAVR